MTLLHTATLPEGQGERWWAFLCDGPAGWGPPALVLEEAALKLKAPGKSGALWTVEQVQGEKWSKARLLS